VVLFRGGAEIIEHYSGLHAGNAAGGIDFKNPCHVFGEIENDGDVATLAGERCTPTAAEQRRAKLAAQRDCGANVIGIAWEHHADRNLPVVGTIRSVESAASTIEAYLTTKLCA
jgi:hypothetical protein